MGVWLGMRGFTDKLSMKPSFFGLSSYGGYVPRQWTALIPGSYV